MGQNEFSGCDRLADIFACQQCACCCDNLDSAIDVIRLSCSSEHLLFPISQYYKAALLYTSESSDVTTLSPTFLAQLSEMQYCIATLFVGTSSEEVLSKDGPVGSA